MTFFQTPLAVVPVLVGPLQVLLALLPAILAAMGGLLLALFKPSAMKKAAVMAWRLKLPIVLIVVAFFGGRYVLENARAGTSGYGDREASDHQWAMFRGGPARLGAVPGDPPPMSPGLVWDFDEELTFYASPAVVGNRVYATSAHLGAFGALGGDRGVIFCLDADAGGVVWRSSIDGYRATFSSPAVFGERLVCGEGLHTTRDARVVCLDSLTGELVWQYRTSSHVESTPCIAEGRIFVGAGDDGYYCFDLEPDANGEARVLWHASGEDFRDCETSPVVHDGRVYVGLGVGGQAVVCLDAETGDEIWRVTTDYPVFGPPSIADGMLFVGMGNGDFVNRAEDIGLAPAGRIIAISLATGTQVWALDLPRTVLGAVAADSKALYFGCRDGRVYAVSHEGAILHEWDSHSALITSPGVTETHVYVVTETGRLYALARSDLRPAWDMNLGAEGAFMSSPAVARGHVYVGSEDYGLLCVGQPGEPAGPRPWVAYRGGPVRAGRADDSPAGTAGRLLGRWPRRRDETSIRAPIAVVKDSFYVPVADGPRKGLARLRNDSEELRTLPELWFFETRLGVHSSPVANEQLVFVVDGRPGDMGRALYAVRADTAVAVWEHELKPDAGGSLLLGSERVYVQDGAHSLTALDLSGNILWRADTGVLAGPPMEAEQILIVASRSRGLSVLDAPKGAVLWNGPAKELTTGPALRGRTILVGAARGIGAYSVLDGAELWQTESGRPGSMFALSDGVLGYVTVDGHFVLLDVASEGTANVDRVLVDRSGAVPGASVLVTSSLAIYADDQGLACYNMTEGATRPWMALDPDFYGSVTGAPVLVDGRLYFSTSNGGLVRAGE